MKKKLNELMFNIYKMNYIEMNGNILRLIVLISLLALCLFAGIFATLNIWTFILLIIIMMFAMAETRYYFIRINMQKKLHGIYENERTEEDLDNYICLVHDLYRIDVYDKIMSWRFLDETI